MDVDVGVGVVVVEDGHTCWDEVEDGVVAAVVGAAGEDAVVDEAAVKRQDVVERNWTTSWGRCWETVPSYG